MGLCRRCIKLTAVQTVSIDLEKQLLEAQQKLAAARDKQKKLKGDIATAGSANLQNTLSNLKNQAQKQIQNLQNQVDTISEELFTQARQQQEQTKQKTEQETRDNQNNTFRNIAIAAGLGVLLLG